MPLLRLSLNLHPLNVLALPGTPVSPPALDTPSPTSGLPRWLGSKESTYQFRRLGFYPWVGKILWRRKRQPTPIFLPEKSQGQRSLAVYSPWSCKESDMTEQLNSHTITEES